MKAIWKGLLVCLLSGALSAPAAAAAEDEPQKSAALFLHKLYEARAAHLISCDSRLLDGLYADNKGAKAARKHEAARCEYVKAWAEARKINFVGASSAVRVTRVKSENGYIQASVVQSLQLSYAHRQPQANTLHFGIGTRHAVKLVRQGEEWRVANEWYSDPLDENPDRIPALTLPEKDMAADMIFDKAVKRRYDRKKALEYADKYAGAAWGAGNNHRYNRKYRDYTPLGGDCTNFASQVIGDAEEGGGLRMNGSWQYWKNSGGSHAWIQTDRLKHFLLYSGYGSVAAKGVYAQVFHPTEQYPQGAFASLKPGDLIAYELEGDIDHFAVFMGVDEKGYPLVNCHTADRFHVPFDLGWDDSTRYWLIHIRD